MFKNILRTFSDAQILKIFNNIQTQPTDILIKKKSVLVANTQTGKYTLVDNTRHMQREFDNPYSYMHASNNIFAGYQPN